ncbi:MAG: bifunctional DNA-formamidopyrimidine glycosylase/DNA-(apurinic or apyrimidinic site) lyase [Candidatus Heimdallarchaeaceae archaeon]
MPEGPEVEYVRRSLEPLLGSKVVKIELTALSQKYTKYRNKQSEFNHFNGQELVAIERKGKFLIWRFSGEKVILNHLGMTGNWLLFQGNSNGLTSHPKVIIKMDPTPNALFDDIRNFGQFRVFNSYEAALNYSPIRRMGIDGLAIPFPLEEFLARIDKPNYANREIGEVLLDQNLVAGIGNIYKSESLALAGINPKRIVKSLTMKERKKLGLSISKILQKALKNQGSSIQSFRNPNGQEGRAQYFHQVYRKEVCQQCGGKIVRIVQKNRSTFFCPNCQK